MHIVLSSLHVVGEYAGDWLTCLLISIGSSRLRTNTSSLCTVSGTRWNDGYFTSQITNGTVQLSVLSLSIVLQIVCKSGISVTGTIEGLHANSVDTRLQASHGLIGIIGLVVVLRVLLRAVRTESVTTPTSCQVITLEVGVLDELVGHHYGVLNRCIVIASVNQFSLACFDGSIGILDGLVQFVERAGGVVVHGQRASDVSLNSLTLFEDGLQLQGYRIAVYAVLISSVSVWGQESLIRIVGNSLPIDGTLALCKHIQTSVRIVTLPADVLASEVGQVGNQSHILNTIRVTYLGNRPRIVCLRSVVYPGSTTVISKHVLETQHAVRVLAVIPELIRACRGIFLSAGLEPNLITESSDTGTGTPVVTAGKEHFCCRVVQIVMSSTLIKCQICKRQTCGLGYCPNAIRNCSPYATAQKQQRAQNE